MNKKMLIFGVLIFMTACSEETKKSVSKEVETIVEVPAGIEAQMVPFDLKGDTERANLIAEVTITEKIEEVDEKPIPYTVFRAEVNEIFKGELNRKEITIKKSGNSEWVVNHNKMYESGEKYILFLKETLASKSDYWVLGEDTGEFQIIDNATIAKLKVPIEEFKEIELNNPKAISETLKQKDTSNTQVIDKEGFIEIVKREIERGK